VTESEPGPAGEADPPGDTAAETPEEKRERVMRRLAEMLRAGPPDLAGSADPVAAGGFPMLPTSGDDFDQESAAALVAALGQFFERQKNQGGEEGAEEPERE
jgi:hypothetical protein